MNYWIGFINFLPFLVTGLLYVGATYYFLKNLTASRIKTLIYIALAFLFLYAVLFSTTQYYLWSNHDLTKTLLNSPISGEVDLPVVLKNLDFLFESRLGYFLFYSWGRFWINPLIVILCTAVFYGFLRVLKKYNERFFREGEIEVGLLMVLLAGWPGFVVFLPLAFMATLLVSVFNLVVLKEEYTTLGLPLLLAGLITSVSGQFFINLLGLTVLNI